MTIIILCVNWFKLVFIKLFRMTLSLNNVFFHKKGGTSVMRRNLQMDVLKEYKVVCCHNYVKYNTIQNKFSLLKLCSIVRINFYVIRYCICIYMYNNYIKDRSLLLNISGGFRGGVRGVRPPPPPPPPKKIFAKHMLYNDN